MSSRDPVIPKTLSGNPQGQNSFHESNMTLFDFIIPISFSFSHRCTSLLWRLMECVLMHCLQNFSVLISNPENINRYYPTHMNKSSSNVSENIFFQSVKGPSDQRVWEPLNTQQQNLCGITPGSFCLPQARDTCSPLSWVSCGVELAEGGRGGGGVGCGGSHCSISSLRHPG